jgi:hypothetical protein
MWGPRKLREFRARSVAPCENVAEFDYVFVGLKHMSLARHKLYKFVTMVFQYNYLKQFENYPSSCPLFEVFRRLYSVSVFR